MSAAEKVIARDAIGASLWQSVGAQEQAQAQGVFTAVFRGYKPEHRREYLHIFERVDAMREEALAEANMARRLILLRDVRELDWYLDTLTEIKGEQIALNVVTTQGKNYLLDNALAGSAFTAAYYLGIIGAVSYTGVPVAADTAASHATWTEAGATNLPTYTGSRKTTAWSAASAGAKALSAGLVFTFTGTGTAKGCFLSTIATVDSTSGSLISAGLFTGGDQPVVNTNTVTVSYSMAL